MCASRAPATSAAGSTAPKPVPACGCSALAYAPPLGQSGSTLLGQNWDWLLHAAQTLVVLEARPDDGPDFVTVVEAGLLAKAGMNAAGLGLVTNALVTEAVKVLSAGPRSSSANYLIAHASGAALDIEAAPGDFTRLYPLFPEDGVLAHTNHFLAP